MIVHVPHQFACARLCTTRSRGFRGHARGKWCYFGFLEVLFDARVPTHLTVINGLVLWDSWTEVNIYPGEGMTLLCHVFLTKVYPSHFLLIGFFSCESCLFFWNNFYEVEFVELCYQCLLARLGTGLERPLIGCKEVPIWTLFWCFVWCSKFLKKFTMVVLAAACSYALIWARLCLLRANLSLAIFSSAPHSLPNWCGGHVYLCQFH